MTQQTTAIPQTLARRIPKAKTDAQRDDNCNDDTTMRNNKESKLISVPPEVDVPCELLDGREALGQTLQHAAAALESSSLRPQYFV